MVPAGQVIRTEPGAGGGIAVTDQVVVVISEGTRQTVVPDVTGLPVPDARTALADAGLSVVESSEVSDVVPAGQVIRTEPGAGESIEADTPVLMVVSEGAGPGETTTSTTDQPETTTTGQPAT